MSDVFYSDDRFTVYCGDALEVLPTLPAQMARAVVLDPPYMMQPASVRGRDDGAAGSSAAPVRLISESARQARRLLVDGGVAPFLCDWRRVPDVSYLLTLSGLRLSGCLSWNRTTVGTGGLFRGAWDPILIASRGTPSAIDRAAIPNTVTVNPPHKRSHPYQKPPEIWEHILRRLPVDGAVVDPYAGSGSSGVAALRLGFRWVGIESDPVYCERLVESLMAVQAAEEVGGQNPPNAMATPYAQHEAEAAEPCTAVVVDGQMVGAEHTGDCPDCRARAAGEAGGE